MELDTQVFYLLHDLTGQSPLFDWSAIFFAQYFPYALILVFVGIVVISGYSKREKLEILFVAAFSGLVARYGVAELIRFFYHRPRPFVALPIHALIPESSWSFPSGHATFFFGMATAVYLYHKRWGVWLFAAAALISICRVIVGVHYPLDIIGGALIGSATAYLVARGVRRFSSKSSNQTS
ncbi:phosphatase PAP2 family protein [Patescibacteria group bacterium]|nr:phosphatase PAP2 family protein [Patescibacteria group bacterium]